MLSVDPELANSLSNASGYHAASAGALIGAEDDNDSESEASVSEAEEEGGEGIAAHRARRKSSFDADAWRSSSWQCMYCTSIVPRGEQFCYKITGSNQCNTRFSRGTAKLVTTGSATASAATASAATDATSANAGDATRPAAEEESEEDDNMSVDGEESDGCATCQA